MTGDPAADPLGKPFYLLLCRQCGDPGRPLPILFESPAARGRWAAEHTRLTGHDRWWVKDLPAEAVTADTRQAPEAGVLVMDGREAGLRRLDRARATGTVITEYAQLDRNGVFLLWDADPAAGNRFPLARRIKLARSYGGLVFRRRVAVIEDWEEIPG